MIASQYLLGVLTLVHYVPVSLAVAHQALALVIVAIWVASVHHVWNLGASPVRNDEATNRRCAA